MVHASAKRRRRPASAGVGNALREAFAMDGRGAFARHVRIVLVSSIGRTIPAKAGTQAQLHATRISRFRGNDEWGSPLFLQPRIPIPVNSSTSLTTSEGPQRPPLMLAPESLLLVSRASSAGRGS